MKPLEEAVRAQLDRVLASSGFRDAGRLGAFLRFVVEETLRGEGPRLKEAVIGVEVFQRPADYDPRIDPVVRVEARRLRARLDEYYAGPGQADRLRISLPKGAYVPVFEESSAIAGPPPVRRTRRFLWLAAVPVLLAIAAFVLLRQPPSPAEGARLLVLPFSNVSQDPANEYFSRGLTEELIDALSQLDGLKVIARSIAFQYAGPNVDVRQVAGLLGVTAVVEGSVRKSGDQLRITAQLINAKDGFQVWSQTWDRKMADIFAVQEEIARAIVSQLRPQLPVKDRSLLSRRYRGNVEAYNLYLRGRHELSRFDEESAKRAVDHFQAATALDPGFAPAFAGLSYVYTFFAYYDEDNSRKWFAGARETAQKALALDDRLPEAHTALGFALAFHEWDWNRASREFHRALELDPNSADAHAWHAAAVLLPRAQFDEANREFGRALELDPGNALTAFVAAYSMLASGRIDDALVLYRRSIDLENRHPDVVWDYGMALGFAKRYREAEVQFRLSHQMRGHPPGPLGALELVFTGHGNEARAVLPRVEAAAREGRIRAVEAARHYAMLGQPQKALDWLETAFQRRERQVLWLQVDPRLRSLQAEPRHRALVRKMGLSTSP
ncbi:MAG: hypothetical protein JNN08_23700 [Bryobacterales bacterium]|nr:hypothetical protein [Bryobacterales bacterium]